jgi:hypothetical protein
VIGTSYVSNTVTFSELMGFEDTKKSVAEKAVNQFPAGCTVPVYYDPENPQKSVLRRGGDSTLLFIGGGFMVFAILFYFLQ